MADFELAVPGVIYIGSADRQKEEASEETPSQHVVHLGAASGWMKPRGIRQWAREVSVIRRSALGDSLRKDLGATLPQEQVAPAKMPLASRAARESPFIAVAENLVEKLVEKGVRVHTIGFDKISGGFYYLAEGGQSPPARIEGDLIEMVSPALEAAGDNADLDSLLEGVIDRILLDISKGDIGEAAVELAAALPRLCTDRRGIEDCDLEAFEREAASLVGRSTPFETLARVLASRLSSTKHSDVVTVPLFGEARREKESVITVNFGNNHTQLSARERWLVSGAPNREITLAPQRANTVRVPTVHAPPSGSGSGDNGSGSARVPARSPTPRPTAGVSSVPSSASASALATPAPSPAPAPALGGKAETPATARARAKPIATPPPNRFAAGGAVVRTALPRPAASDRRIGTPPPASDRNPSLSAKAGPPHEPSPPPAETRQVYAPPAEDEQRLFEEDRISFPGPQPSHPDEREKQEYRENRQNRQKQESHPGAQASASPEPADEPLFAAAASPVEEPEEPAPAIESPIFAAAPQRVARGEVEPEPMTQPSQRRRREMEEAEARVREARRLALWLVIGVILILAAVYIIWSMQHS